MRLVLWTGRALAFVALLVVAILIGRMLVGASDASASAPRAAPRSCPVDPVPDFTYHVQVRGISCRLAARVIAGVYFDESTFEFEGPNPWWRCRERDGAGLAYGGRRLRCTLLSSDIRWTSRLF